MAEGNGSQVSAKSRKAGFRPPSWLIVVGAFYVGLLYLGVYLLLSSHVAVCLDANNSPVPGFWGSYFSCLQMNTLGDALSGAFAPLAFIFLAAALIIQSLELSEQRTELRETKEVMERQLEVAERQANLTAQQVEETKASTDLFRKQTEILQRDQKAREERIEDEKFEQRLNNLKTVIRLNGHIVINVKGVLPSVMPVSASADYIIEDIEGEVVFLSPSVHDLSPFDPEAVIGHMSEHLDRFLYAARNGEMSFTITSDEAWRMKRFMEALSEIVRDSIGISERCHLRMDGLGLNHLRSQIEEMLKIMKRPPN